MQRRFARDKSHTLQISQREVITEPYGAAIDTRRGNVLRASLTTTVVTQTRTQTLTIECIPRSIDSEPRNRTNHNKYYGNTNNERRNIETRLIRTEEENICPFNSEMLYKNDPVAMKKLVELARKYEKGPVFVA